MKTPILLRVTRVVLVVLALALLVATALPIAWTNEWWVRAFDFPRFQIAILLGLALTGLLLAGIWRRGAWGRVLVIALLAAIAYQTVWMLPYTRLAPVESHSGECPPEGQIRLLIANVLMENRQSERLLALVAGSDPDVLVAVETDGWWHDRLGALSDAYPFQVARPQANTYGMHLLSRLELGDPQVKTLIEEDVPSIWTAVRLRSGAWIDLYALHPRPPVPVQDTEERDAEVLIVAREVRERGRPAIVAGDLNDVGWSHTTKLFQKISRTLDPRIGRGMFPTFSATVPLLRWPLDHLFHTEDFTLASIARLDAFGSDHFPMLVTLCHQPAAGAAQDPPEADAEERDRAREKVREGVDAGREP